MTLLIGGDLDHETQSAFDITITTADFMAGTSSALTLSVTVTDVNEEPLVSLIKLSISY